MGDGNAGMGMTVLMRWLEGLGYHDGAARLFGVLTQGRLETWPNPPPEVAALPDALGEAGFTAAIEAGGALDPRAAAELAHRVLAQVRADHLDA
jgi:hypothetical protein